MSDGIRALWGELDLLRAWLFEQALPCWSSRGLDRSSGGFFEKLNPDGRPTTDARRARVTARQTYAFAIARKLGWAGPARELMRYAIDNLFRRHLDPVDGMVIATVSPEGEVLRADFDLYDHAFVLLGLASAVGEGERVEELSARAARLRADMKAGWAHPIAGFEESRPRSEPLKANPHMHLLEAALAWMEVSDDRAWGEFADEIAELGLRRFVTPESGAVREYFDGDWGPIESRDLAVLEPGHQFEWAWLLLRWGRLRDREDAIAAARRLLAIGEGPGVCPARDLVINELNPDLSVRDGLSRLWPQTERIKAHARAMSAADDDEGRDASAALAARAAAGLRRYFEHPLEGAWWEHIGLDGGPLVEPARATSLYHIICAIHEVTDQLTAVSGQRTALARAPDAPSASERGLRRERENPMKYVSPFANLKNRFVVGSADGEVWAKIKYSDLEDFLRMILLSVEVDENWYRATYADIDEAIRNGVIKSAKQHFVTSGYFEGRLPYPMSVDEEWYLTAYEDIRAAVHAGTFTSASEHFATFGYAEGRLPGDPF